MVSPKGEASLPSFISSGCELEDVEDWMASEEAMLEFALLLRMELGRAEVDADAS